MTKSANSILIAALLLGVAAERLLGNGPGGPAWLLWLALLGATSLVVVWRGNFEWKRETAVGALIAVAAAAIPIIRATDALFPLTMLVLIASASVPMLRARALRFGNTLPVQQLLGLPLVGLHAVLGTPALLAQDVEYSAVPRQTMRVPMIVLRGFLLALLPLIIFAALFVSADPTFEKYMQALISFQLQELLQHLVLAAAFAWISAGLLRGLLPRSDSTLRYLPAMPRVPGPEVAVALGLVALLFVAFLIIQMGSGNELLSSNARNGFFQLVVASALVLPMLVAADAAVAETTGRTRSIVRALCILLIVCVFLIMLSALNRMRLYVDHFGLTEDRLYATTFMAWLALVFLWLIATTLRGRPHRFAAGPVVAGIAAVFVLAALNPDALIARVNLNKAKSGAELDSAYLTRLSADAAPVLFDHLNELPAKDACALVKKFSSTTMRDEDWRTYNVARARARSLSGQVLFVCSAASKALRSRREISRLAAAAARQ